MGLLDGLLNLAVIGGAALLAANQAQKEDKSFTDYVGEKYHNFSDEVRSAQDSASSMSDREILQAYRDSNSVGEKFGYMSAARKRHEED